MLIGKPVSPSTRQPIPQPVHRQYPLRLVGIFLQLLPQQLQSTPPARAATPAKFTCSILSGFQSTPPARAATPRPSHPTIPKGFQSTPPARAATDGSGIVMAASMFPSTPPARAATV